MRRDPAPDETIPVALPGRGQRPVAEPEPPVEDPETEAPAPAEKESE